MNFRNLLIAFLLVTFSANTQVGQHAKWKFSNNAKSPKVGDIVDLYIDAQIEKDWYLYSSDFAADLGPTLTTLELKANDGFSKVGKLIPVHPKKKFDEVWQGNVTYFIENARFIQKVKILKENVKIEGLVDYQTCTDVSGLCVPGKEKFSFDIKAEKGEILTSENTKVDNEVAETSEIVSEDSSIVSEVYTTPLIESKEISTNPIEKDEESSLLSFLLIAFATGLASIFMPCIYPIMPMTVSFFTKQKNGKSKAVFYGISIMVIFGLVGSVTMAFGAPFLNFISTHWIPNLIFFVIFIIFGISLLGAFEIVLPHEAVNKVDALSDKGGLLGIFFMALTLVLVSFSCTVPLVGTLLIAAAQGEVMRPVFGMLAFGLPFALVFSGLAMFPSVLKTLPKSGGWLNELKAVFGFLEFALALKFLSNIDLAYHWNLLHRNIFLVLWIIIAVITGLYILGFMRLSKDTKVEKYSPLRIGFAVLFFAIAAYMIPGVTNKSLPLLSGILPPMPVAAVTTDFYADYPKDQTRALPHGLMGFYDFDDAQAYAKKVNMPILIDFTGYACANCRKMEENVWPDPEVLNMLKNDYIIASLYVDDKKKLPTEKQYTSTYDDDLKTTVGDKNMDLEITKYNNNAQPLYVIVNPQGEKILDPVSYTTIKEFTEFLKKGKGEKKKG